MLIVLLPCKRMIGDEEGCMCILARIPLAESCGYQLIV